MSSAVFPGTIAAMPGLAWSVGKVPEFNSKTQISVGNSELRASFTQYPRWRWTLRYTWLLGGSASAAFETLAAFFLSRRGSYDSFLYTDPTDSSVTDQSFGTGTGSQTAFQLYRGLGGFLEPVYNVNAITNVKVNGTPTALYTQSGGVITFNSAPANGAALTWTGTYYWRVRFLEDIANFAEFANNFWENQSLGFISVLNS